MNINQWKICPAKYKTIFKVDVENQLVFTKQPVVYTNRFENQR